MARMLTEEAYRRTARAVRWVESNQGATARATTPRPGAETIWARVTSATADASGHYPGVITLYSASDEAWNDYSTVRVKPANGETLEADTRYPVRPAGRTPSPGNEELYVTLAAASIVAETMTVLIADVADGDGYYPAHPAEWSTVFDEWGVESDEDVLVVSTNGEPLVINDFYQVRRVGTEGSTPVYATDDHRLRAFTANSFSPGETVVRVQDPVNALVVEIGAGLTLSYGEGLSGTGENSNIGFVRLGAQAASDAAWGMVTTGSQSFAGTKQFETLNADLLAFTDIEAGLGSGLYGVTGSFVVPEHGITPAQLVQVQKGIIYDISDTADVGSASIGPALASSWMGI